jgi:hypothetical protein
MVLSRYCTADLEAGIILQYCRACWVTVHKHFLEHGAGMQTAAGHTACDLYAQQVFPATVTNQDEPLAVAMT